MESLFLGEIGLDAAVCTCACLQQLFEPVQVAKMLFQSQCFTPRRSHVQFHAQPRPKLRNVALVAAAESSQEQGLVARFSDQLRALPLAAGATGFVALLLNRSASGVAPVVDASSAQSRVDVLVIALAATLALTGFQWLALKPVEKEQVEPIGEPVSFIRTGLKRASASELLWAWQALRSTTCCRTLVVIFADKCILHQGLGPPGRKPGKAQVGSICRGVMKDGKANYLANLALFPGRIEFESVLPPNASCAIVAPVGRKGVLIAAGDIQRGFSKVDQAWITSIADKLDDTFENSAPAVAGFQAKR